MIELDTGNLIAWTLIAAGGVFALTANRLSMGAAIGVAALAGMLAKSALLELV